MVFLTYTKRYALSILLPILLLVIMVRGWGMDWRGIAGMILLSVLFILFQRVMRLQRLPSSPPPFGEGEAEGMSVGGGWSFFLRRRRMGKKANLERRGIVVDKRREGMWWNSGSTIGEVQSYLTKRGMTLGSHPSILSVTLGGWIASMAHGSGGSLWKPCTGRLLVERRGDGREPFYIQKKGDIFKDESSVEELRKYRILEVEVLPTKDILVLRRCSWIEREEDLHPFFYDPSYLRFLQVGRRGVVCIAWVPCQDEGKDCYSSTSTSFLDRERTWIQAEVLTIYSFPSSTRWPSLPSDRKMLLSQANDYTPSPPLLSWIGLFYTNFEVFYRRKGDVSFLTPSFLFPLLSSLRRLLSGRGRCEVRCGRDKLFLDFVIHSGEDPSPLFSLLSSSGIDPVSLHKGKHQVPVSPCTLLHPPFSD